MIFVPSWVNVSHETFQKLEQYATLLEKWNSKINLVSRETIADLWNRHIWDSVQLINFISPEITRMIDLGSGAGLPGIILSILKSMEVTLVERDQRKAAFLTEAVRLLGLSNVKISNSDINDIGETYPLITARALASLEELCTLAHPLSEEMTICLFPKGENFANELKEAQKHWSFAYTTKTSRTNSNSCIILLSKLKSKN